MYTQSCWQHQDKLPSINCVDQYRKYLIDPDLNLLTQCYGPNLHSFSSIDTPNPINYNEMCKLITNRRSNYYIHTYNPKPVLNIYKDKIAKIFDFKPRSQCCNCVAIVLYSTNHPEAILYRYLPSIIKTIQNVKNSLSDWIVRLYLDVSVFETIKSLKHRGDEVIDPRYKKLRINMDLEEIFVDDMIDYIFNADNVEVYTYLCSSLLDTDVEKIRTFRFLPMIDSTVNVCAIREADGIVTNLDCHNLRMFSQSERIFYFIPLSGFMGAKGIYHPEGDVIKRGYSEWISLYKKELRPDFFAKYNNLYDILAGTLALRLKLKEEIYVQHVMNLESMISSNWNFLYNYGFDEILLLDIFKEVISVSFTSNDGITIGHYNRQELEAVEAMIFGIDIIRIDGNSISDIFNQLKAKKYVRGNLMVNDIKSRIGVVNKYCEGMISYRDDRYRFDRGYRCHDDINLYGMDQVLVPGNIITNNMFDVEYGSKSILSLVNEEYSLYFIFDQLDRNKRDALFRKFIK